MSASTGLHQIGNSVYVVSNVLEFTGYTVSKSGMHNDDHAVSPYMALCHRQMQSLVEHMYRITDATLHHAVSPCIAAYRKQVQSLVGQMLSLMRG